MSLQVKLIHPSVDTNRREIKRSNEMNQEEDQKRRQNNKMRTPIQRLHPTTTTSISIQHRTPEGVYTYYREYTQTEPAFFIRF